jgi:hypothetical protein
MRCTSRVLAVVLPITTTLLLTLRPANMVKMLISGSVPRGTEVFVFVAVFAFALMLTLVPVFAVLAAVI